MPTTVRVQNFQSIEDATVVIDGFTVITGPNNSGKALAHGTRVATPKGWVTVESLCAGDMVLAGDGTPTPIEGVYPQGYKETCRITFDDGRTCLVDWDHLWSVAIGDARFGSNASFSTMTTKEIVERVGLEPTAFQRPLLPAAGPAMYDPRPVPLDPYLVGVLLGDGCFGRSSVRFSSADVGVVNAVQAALPVGSRISPCGKYDFRLVGGRWRHNPVLDAVRELGLANLKAHEKFVPEAYLYNEVESRVSLLQGLMDTDGTVNKQGVPEFCSTSKPLALDVRELVHSLGGTARIRSKIPTYKYKGEVRQGREAFTVTFRLRGFEVFRLERKQRLVSDPVRTVQPIMVSFEEGPAIECSCIEVQHPSHLFQIDGHIVTHNTAFMRAIKGVFTNAAPGPLVRHGTNHLTVTIDFGDGNIVKWEKGWEKPGQKGGTVNRYTINGKLYDKVGATPPDELFELRFGPAEVGNRKLWPQVADQFEGVLFLIGSTGSTVAEAIADVERVGKLNTALRSCESDKRSVRSKLKVRREDCDEVEKQVDAFTGLDDAAAVVSAVEDLSAAAVGTAKELAKARKLAARLATLQAEVDKYAGVGQVELPNLAEVKSAGRLRDRLVAAKNLSVRLSQARSTSGKLEGVSKVKVPDASLQEAAQALRQELRQAVALRTSLTRGRQRVKKYEGLDLDLPSDAGVEKLRKTARTLDKVRGYRDDIMAKREAIEKLAKAIEGAKVELGGAEDEVHAVLGEHGECPTCGTVMGAA